MYFGSSPLRISSTIPSATSQGPGNKSLRVNRTANSQAKQKDGRDCAGEHQRGRRTATIGSGWSRIAAHQGAPSQS